MSLRRVGGASKAPIRKKNKNFEVGAGRSEPKGAAAGEPAPNAAESGDKFAGGGCPSPTKSELERITHKPTANALEDGDNAPKDPKPLKKTRFLKAVDKTLIKRELSQVPKNLWRAVLPSHYRRSLICGTPINKKRAYIAKIEDVPGYRNKLVYRCGSRFCPTCAYSAASLQAANLKEIHKKWRDDHQGMIFYAVVTKRGLGNAKLSDDYFLGYEQSFLFERYRADELNKRLSKLKKDAGLVAYLRTSEFTISPPKLNESGNYHGHANLVLYCKSDTDSEYLKERVIEINTSALKAAALRLIEKFPETKKYLKMDSLWIPEKGFSFEEVPAGFDDKISDYVTKGVQNLNGDAVWSIEAEATMAVVKRGTGSSFGGMELLEVAADEERDTSLRDWAARARFKMAELHAKYRARAYGFSFMRDENGKRVSFAKWMINKDLEQEGSYVLTHTGHGVTAEDVADVVDATELDPQKWAEGEHEHLQAMLDVDKDEIRKRLAKRLVENGHLDSQFVAIFADPVALQSERIRRGVVSKMQEFIEEPDYKPDEVKPVKKKWAI